MTSLADLAAGRAGTVTEVTSPPARRERLAAFGLVRGTAVLVIQRRPALVFRIDAAEIAIDPRIGLEIGVEPAAA